MVTPGVAIDYFPPLLSLSCFLSFIRCLFPTHWQLVCRSKATGAPTTWGAELQNPKQKQNKSNSHITDKDAPKHHFIMRVMAKKLALATSTIREFSCSRKRPTFRLADIRKKTALALETWHQMGGFYLIWGLLWLLSVFCICNWHKGWIMGSLTFFEPTSS